MSMNDDVARTLSAAKQSGHWHGWAAVAGMLVMFGAMVALMWFLAQPAMDPRAWGLMALSVAGLVLWRYMLALTSARIDKKINRK